MVLPRQQAAQLRGVLRRHVLGKPLHLVLRICDGVFVSSKLLRNPGQELRQRAERNGGADAFIDRLLVRRIVWIGERRGNLRDRNFAEGIAEAGRRAHADARDDLAAHALTLQDSRSGAPDGTRKRGACGDAHAARKPTDASDNRVVLPMFIDFPCFQVVHIVVYGLRCKSVFKAFRHFSLKYVVCEVFNCVVPVSNAPVSHTGKGFTVILRELFSGGILIIYSLPVVSRRTSGNVRDTQRSTKARECEVCGNLRSNIPKRKPAADGEAAGVAFALLRFRLRAECVLIKHVRCVIELLRAPRGVSPFYVGKLRVAVNLPLRCVCEPLPAFALLRRRRRVSPCRVGFEVVPCVFNALPIAARGVIEAVSEVKHGAADVRRDGFRVIPKRARHVVKRVIGRKAGLLPRLGQHLAAVVPLVAVSVAPAPIGARRDRGGFCHGRFRAAAIC